jgi:multidrug resistance efflux pump
LAERQQVESTLADLTQAEANSANAAAEETRYRALVEKHEVSREQHWEGLANRPIFPHKTLNNIVNQGI